MILRNSNLYIKQKSTFKLMKMLFVIVGAAGFEPATPWSQTRCANRTALHPDDFMLNAERAGFEPAVPITKYVSLANWWIKPLSHPSFAFKAVQI